MEIKTSLLGKKCWYVSCGGSAGYSFELSLGRKFPRPRPLKNPSCPEEFRQYEPEIGLLVWCSWTLRDARGHLTGSDDETDGLEKGLRRLVHRLVRSVEIGTTNWYLRLGFSGGLDLYVFPDHVGPAASFDGNWEVWRPTDAYLIGTDLSCEVIERDYPLVEPGEQAGDEKTAGRQGSNGTAKVIRQSPRVVRFRKMRSATSRKQEAPRR